jgi:hypothetical protein
MYLYCSDLLCDLLQMLNLINIGSAVATRRNLVDPIQRTNMRGLMAERFRVFDLRMEGLKVRILMDPFFHFIFFHLFLIFMCNFFSAYFSILSPFFSSIDF